MAYQLFVDATNASQPDRRPTPTRHVSFVCVMIVDVHPLAPTRKTPFKLLMITTPRPQTGCSTALPYTQEDGTSSAPKAASTENRERRLNFRRQPCASRSVQDMPANASPSSYGTHATKPTNPTRKGYTKTCSRQAPQPSIRQRQHLGHGIPPSAPEQIEPPI